jgi:hypothetical protein
MITVLSLFAVLVAGVGIAWFLSDMIRENYR